MPAARPGGQGLPRKRRLKQPRDFARTRSQGRRLSCGCLIFNWCRAAKASNPRLGVITSKKVGGAVVRNRARRLLREAYRRHQALVAEPMDIVLVAKSQMAGLPYGAVERDFLTALKRAGLLKTNELGGTHGAA